ncbi:MAG: hypothetical protein J0I77_03265 [Rudaea sp.]|nr:hypothetical protein [Rudaea sp.]
MKKKRFAVEQIVAVLKQAELGMAVADLTRQVGDFGTDLLSLEAAVWWSIVRSSPRAEAVAGRERAAEETGGGVEFGQGHSPGCRFKKMARPALKRVAVAYTVSRHCISQRRACRLLRQHRSAQAYVSCRDPRTALRRRMHEIAKTRVRCG